MKVRSKILDFYANQGLPISRLHQLKPRGTSDADIEAAAVLAYREKFKGGIEISDNDLLRYIRRRSLYITNTKGYRRQILEELIENYRQEGKDWDLVNRKVIWWMVYSGVLTMVIVGYILFRIFTGEMI